MIRIHLQKLFDSAGTAVRPITHQRDEIFVKAVQRSACVPKGGRRGCMEIRFELLELLVQSGHLL